MGSGVRAILADPNQFQPATFKVFLSIQFPLHAATNPGCWDEKLLGLSVPVVEPFLERESTGPGSSGIRRWHVHEGCGIRIGGTSPALPLLSSVLLGDPFPEPLLLSFTDCLVCSGCEVKDCGLVFWSMHWHSDWGGSAFIYQAELMPHEHWWLWTELQHQLAEPDEWLKFYLVWQFPLFPLF